MTFKEIMDSFVSDQSTARLLRIVESNPQAMTLERALALNTLTIMANQMTATNPRLASEIKQRLRRL